MQSYFVTGTDTDVGKTYVSAILLKAASEAGKKTVGYKPVSAGCEVINGRLVNEDASQLLANSSLPVTQDKVNPIAFVPPIAPHIAAKEAGVAISAETIKAGYMHLKAMSPDLLIMEGGRWLAFAPGRQALPVRYRSTVKVGCHYCGGYATGVSESCAAYG